jgi:PAT family beta-lactamase induction signal transducer AmpG
VAGRVRRAAGRDRSATQDIVIDAFRVESLDKSEQAAGMASYVAAYRIGMLASTVGVLYLVAGFELFGFATTAAWSVSFHREWPYWC